MVSQKVKKRRFLCLEPIESIETQKPEKENLRDHHD